MTLIENEGPENMKYNFSESEIKGAAKMYYALNSCPSFFEKLYLKAINEPASRISLLASNILKKVEGNSNEKALKIFIKMTEVLRFQHISYQQGEKRTISDVKGKM